jgi:hypothetical protein
MWVLWGETPNNVRYLHVLLPNIYTWSEAHPASCAMCTGGPFPGTKARPGRDADHSNPSSAEVENE